MLTILQCQTKRFQTWRFHSTKRLTTSPSFKKPHSYCEVSAYIDLQKLRGKKRPFEVDLIFDNFIREGYHIFFSWHKIPLPFSYYPWLVYCCPGFCHRAKKSRQVQIPTKSYLTAQFYIAKRWFLDNFFFARFIIYVTPRDGSSALIQSTPLKK